uniref:Ig-like domain-containing protein n=1 Tax=Oncorhynchus mykiss TaxID=8022 RepID=A0A8K9XYL8_ONCMY
LVPMIMFYAILLFSIAIGGNNIKTEECVFEGDGITLSCNYTGSYSIDTLLWYQQYTRTEPEFLFFITEEAFKTHNKSTHPRLPVKLNDEKTNVDLKISSAEGTETVLYYCALQSTSATNCLWDQSNKAYHQ